MVNERVGTLAWLRKEIAEADDTDNRARRMGSL